MDVDISESVWRRGFSDAKRMILSFPGFVLEAGGGAAVAYLAPDPLWGVVWFLGAMVSMWVCATVLAPLRQRNECRQLIAEFTDAGSESEWLTLDEAARFFRDQAERIGQENLVFVYDDFVSQGRQVGSNRPIEEAVLPWLRDGMDRGIIVATGIAENGGARVQISPSESLEFFGSNSFYDQVPVGSIAAKTGVVFIDVRIRQSSIVELLDVYAADTIARAVLKLENREVDL